MSSRMPDREALKPYSFVQTTLYGAAFNSILLYAMTSEGRIKGVALATLSSLTVNLSHHVLKNSGERKNLFHFLHKSITRPIAASIAEKTAPRRSNQNTHDRAYCEIRRDLQLVTASLVSGTIIGLFNHFILKTPALGFKGAFALSMVPALYSRSVQIRYDWEENHHSWGMEGGPDSQRNPIYPYDRPTY